MKESVMNKWTTALALAALLILLFLSNVAAAPAAPTRAKAHVIAATVQARGWQALPHSPHIGCLRPRPDHRLCWIDTSEGVQVRFTLHRTWEVGR